MTSNGRCNFGPAKDDPHDRAILPRSPHGADPTDPLVTLPPHASPPIWLPGRLPPWRKEPFRRRPRSPPPAELCRLKLWRPPAWPLCADPGREPGRELGRRPPPRALLVLRWEAAELGRLYCSPSPPS